MTRTVELGIIGIDDPIIVIHYEEDGTQTVEIPHMHLSEDCSEWLFNDVEDNLNIE